MRIHTYAAGSQSAVTHPEVAPDVRLRGLVIIEAGEAAYRIGDEAEVDVEVTVSEIFGEGPGHVIVHHCREIAVTISYAGADKVITVRPSARIEEIRTEAIKVLGQDPLSSADLVLRLPGSAEELPDTSPVGAFV